MKKLTLLMLILTTVMACFMLTSCLGDTPSEDEECEKHIYKPWKILEEATCEKTGLKQRYCIYCGEIQTEVIPTSGHVIAKLPAKAQTCKNEGLTEGEKCSVCNEILVAQEVIAPHFMSLMDELDPTCTERGMKKYECEKCDHVQVEVLEAYGHVPETVLGYEETCTEAGLSDGSKCTICDEVLQAQQTIEPAHKPMAVKGYASSCTETGLTDGKKCERCDEILVEQKEIAALGHNKLALSAKAPTCKETGLTAGEKCSRCDEIFVAQEIVDVISCDKQIYVSGKAATCQTVGYTEGYKCSMCGEMQEGFDEIAKTPHEKTFIEGYDSTCESIGYTDGYLCSQCYNFVEGHEEIEKKPHTEETFFEIKATCEEPGKAAGVKCTVCQEVLSGGEEIDALGHNYENDICKVCGKDKNALPGGAVVNADNGLELTLSQDGTYFTVTGKGTCTETSITIPRSYKNIKVTKIGADAFSNDYELKSVYIPSSVVEIEPWAFYSCNQLDSVIFEATDDWMIMNGWYEVPGLDDPAQAALCLSEAYYDYCWKRNTREKPTYTKGWHDKDAIISYFQENGYDIMIATDEEVEEAEIQLNQSFGINVNMVSTFIASNESRAVQVYFFETFEMAEIFYNKTADAVGSIENHLAGEMEIILMGDVESLIDWDEFLINQQ